MADDVSGGGEASSPVLRELRLDQLCEGLDAAHASAEQSRISSEALQADIAVLLAASGDADRAVDAYRRARTRLERQRDGLTNAVEPVRRLVDSSENRALLDEEWQCLEDELKALRADRCQVANLGRARRFESAAPRWTGPPRGPGDQRLPEQRPAHERRVGSSMCRLVRLERGLSDL